MAHHVRRVGVDDADDAISRRRFVLRDTPTVHTFMAGLRISHGLDLQALARGFGAHCPDMDIESCTDMNPVRVTIKETRGDVGDDVGRRGATTTFFADGSVFMSKIKRADVLVNAFKVMSQSLACMLVDVKLIDVEAMVDKLIADEIALSIMQAK